MSNGSSGRRDRSTARNIVITGASSGIGAALARYYAKPGTTLGLCARDAPRLAAVTQAARDAGATVTEGLFDLRDTASLTTFLNAFDITHPVDLLIASAGVLEGRSADGALEDAAMARRVIEINLLGSIDTVHAVLPAMRQRRAGHIVLVGSLAGLSPLIDAPAYSASKAGLLSFGRAMRLALASDGVHVSVVCPGYVETAMTDTHIGNHPHKISADRAAQLIVAGIARNAGVIGFPWLLYVLSLLTPFTPDWLYSLATRDIRFHVSPRT